MGISFFEVMAGEVTDTHGKTHPLRFEIKGESTDLFRYVRSGEVKITGVVDCPLFACSAALEGEMVISPLRRKKISYGFRFRDSEGRACRFVGRKEIRFTKPVFSMTHLGGVIEREGVEIARGELRFDLDDLPEFLSSWWPSSTIPQREMHAPLGDFDPDTVLTKREREILWALAQVIFVESETVPAADERTLEETLFQLQSLPARVFGMYRVGLRWLDHLPLLTEQSRFADLPLERRKQLLQEWTEGDSLRDRVHRLMGASAVVEALAMVPKAAHFGRSEYLEAIGHPAPREIPKEAPERFMRRVTAAEDLEEETEIEAHAVIVGTGAGGAALAYQLAKKGLAVAIIEEGRYFLRHDFGGPPMGRMHAMYRHRSTKISLGTPIVLPQGRVVGGTTTINSGTCFPTPDSVLQEWRRDLGFPEDFDPGVYGAYSEQVAEMLQVAPGVPEALGKIAGVVGRGADLMGLGHGPLPRNAPGCPGVGECVLGCPEGAKRSTDVSYIPAALRAGAELYVGLPATRILMSGSRAVAVEARGTDRFGRPRTLRVRAERVILSTGALQSPVMLRENGFRLPMIGENLSVHPALGVIARTGEDLEPWNAIPQGYAVHALEDQGIRFEGYYLHPQLFAPLLPWTGEELSRWMDDFPRLGQFGFMVRDGGDGRVRRGPDGSAVVEYRLSDRSMDRMKVGASLLAELFLHAGAEEVFVGFGPRPIVRTRSEAQKLKGAVVGPMDFRLLGAHPLGTCRMAPDSSLGVVDFDHRVFGTDNLHVVDGSSVPTSLGVNPQMTIMAMALRAGDRIGAHLGA
jgi:choline dehydrogenase-like flavoprotein